MATTIKYTSAGEQKIINALNGTDAPMKLERFKASTDTIDLSGSNNVNDVPSHYADLAITSKQIIATNKIKIHMVVDAVSATHEANSWAIYDEDGTAVMVCSLNAPMASNVTQDFTFIIEVNSLNNCEIDFSNIGGSINGMPTFPTLADLQAYMPRPDVAHLQGIETNTDGRGGIFHYDATQSGVNNGGTIFNGWVREYNDFINVKWFGAIADGVTDNSAAFTAAANATTDKQLIFIPTGQYYTTTGGSGEYITGGNVEFTKQDTDGIAPRCLINMTSAVGKSKIQRNLGYHNGQPRDELQIYNNNDAYMSGSLGAGIHLYGVNDPKHCSNIAFMTGKADKGTARMIIGGGTENPLCEGYRTNEDTRITIGNGIWNFVDNQRDAGMLTLHYPIDRPALFFESCTWDIGWEHGNDFDIGTWTAGEGDILRTWKNAITYTKNSGLYLYDIRDGHNNSKHAALYATFSEDNNTELLEIRANVDLAHGSGIDMYGNNDTDDDKAIKFYTGGVKSLQINGTGTRDIRAGSDGVQSLGTSYNRWDNVYATNGAIITSDERMKTEISDIPKEVLKAWSEVPIKRFKLKSAVDKKGDKARWHIGRIAQDIIKVFKEHGLDALEYGIVCYEEWEEKIEENGVIRKAGDRYSIRYDEASQLDMALLMSR